MHGLVDPRRPTVARRSDLLWRRTASAQILVLQPGSDKLVILAGVAAEIWDLLATPCDLDEMVAVLAIRHGEAPASIAADLHEAVGDLSARGLVEPIV